MRRWTHGHTVATGFAGGLLIDRHALYVFVLGALIGGLIVYSSRTLRSIARAAGNRAAELHAATLERVRAQAAESRAKADQRIRRAAEQAAAEKKAYVQGAIDGGKP